MSSDFSHQSTRDDGRRQAVQRVIDQCISKRLSGVDISDHDIIEAHPDLLPELAEELRDLAVIERARMRSKAVKPPGSSTPRSAAGADHATTAPPDLFLGYDIQREVHRGGQGVVYEAVHQSTGRRVAIKVLHGGWSAGHKELARLQREVRILASLRHPHIVSVHESGEGADGSVYFVMDYVDGVPLDEFADQRWNDHKRPPSSVIREKLQLFSKIGAAVHEAHLRGVIHRDLKPGNILVDTNDQPQVLDFGLAKLMDDSEVDGNRRGMTRTGQFIGSLPWASPEQAEGESFIDVRSDVYSLGVVLYQLLTGSLPYPIEGSTRQLLEHVVHTNPPPVSRSIAAADADVDTIVAKCLSKDRERRYQSAGEINRDIELFLQGEPILARRDSTWYVLRKSLKRHRFAVAAMLSLFFIVLISATALAFMFNNQRDARNAESRMRNQAETVTQYLQNMLSSAHADVATRPDLTMRDVLDQAAARVDRDLSEQPLVEAAVRITLGRAYQSLGRFDEAGEHLLQALAIRERDPDASPLDIAAAQLYVGQWHRASGRHDEAIRYLQKVLETRRELLPPDDYTIATALTSYGAAEVERANFDKGERMLREAVAIYRTQPQRDRGLAIALSHLGGAYYDMGRIDEAAKYFEEVLAIRRQADDVPDRLLAGGMHNLAASYVKRGDLDRAEQLFEQSLSIRREVLGPAHPDVAETLAALSGVAYHRRQLDVARARHEEAVAILRKTYEPDHPELLTLTFNLGLILVESGELDAALDLFESQLPLERGRYGDSHPRIADTLTLIARIKQRTGQVSEAETLYEEALAIRRAHLDPKSRAIAETLSDLGSIAHEREQFDKAERLHREALEIRRAVYPPESEHIAASICMLGSALLDEGRTEEAEPLLRECLDSRTRTRPGHWMAYSAMVRMGACLVDLGKDAEAEPMLRVAYDGLQAVPNAPASTLELARRELRELYEKTDQPEMAQQFVDPNNVE